MFNCDDEDFKNQMINYYINVDDILTEHLEYIRTDNNLENCRNKIKMIHDLIEITKLEILRLKENKRKN